MYSVAFIFFYFCVCLDQHMPPPRSAEFEAAQAALLVQCEKKNPCELTSSDAASMFQRMDDPSQPDSPRSALLRAELKGVGIARYRFDRFRLALLHSCL